MENRPKGRDSNWENALMESTSDRIVSNPRLVHGFGSGGNLPAQPEEGGVDQFENLRRHGHVFGDDCSHLLEA